MSDPDDDLAILSPEWLALLQLAVENGEPLDRVDSSRLIRIAKRFYWHGEHLRAAREGFMAGLLRELHRLSQRQWN